jgi:hypothetical protein
MTSTATLRWIALALLGIAVAAGVAIVAGNLAGRQIGLSSEPISAGDSLAPVKSASKGHGSGHSGSAHGGGGGGPAPSAPPTTTTTPTAPETTTAPPFEPQPSPEAGDDSHGGGGGGGDSGGSGGSGGHGADD